MKVSQRLKGDKFGLLYLNLSHLIGESPVWSECFEIFGRGTGKISQVWFSNTDISRITSKPHLTKSFAISMWSMLESGNSAEKKKNKPLDIHIKGKSFPHCLGGLSSPKALNTNSALLLSMRRLRIPSRDLFQASNTVSFNTDCNRAPKLWNIQFQKFEGVFFV